MGYMDAYSDRNKQSYGQDPSQDPNQVDVLNDRNSKKGDYSPALTPPDQNSAFQQRQNAFDYGQSKGNEVFYSQDMMDAGNRIKDLSKGYSGNELGALKSQANAESGAKRSQYLSQLSAKAARGGVGGARAAAMQGAADVGMQGQNNEMQRKMTLDNAEMIRKGNKEFTNFMMKQKYGPLALGTSYQKMQLAEQTRDAAAAAAAAGGDGGDGLPQFQKAGEFQTFGNTFGVHDGSGDEKREFFGIKY